MPVEIRVRGSMILGTLFLVGSSFTFARTPRDESGNAKLIDQMPRRASGSRCRKRGEGMNCVTARPAWMGDAGAEPNAHAQAGQGTSVRKESS